MNQKQIENTIALALVIVGSMMFSAKPIVIKLMYEYDINTIQTLFLRMIFAFPIYFVILLIQRKTLKENMERSFILPVLFFGMSGFYIASFLDFWGLNYITASLERIILFLNPTQVLILSVFILGKKIHRFQVVAIVISYIGIMLAFLSNHEPGSSNNLILGSILVFLAALFYALYLVGAESYIKRIGVLPFTCIAMITATICITIHFIVTSDIKSVFHFPSRVYMLAIIMAIFCTVVPSFMISAGIKKIGANNSAIIGGIGPVTTLVLAYLILNERMGIWQIIGSALVILGVVVISVSLKKHDIKNRIKA